MLPNISKVALMDESDRSLEARAQDLFWRADVDQAGFITFDTLIDVMQRAGLSHVAASRTASNFIGQADADFDDAISRREFGGSRTSSMPFNALALLLGNQYLLSREESPARNIAER